MKRTIGILAPVLVGLMLMGAMALGGCKDKDKDSTAGDAAGTWRAVKFKFSGTVPISIDISSADRAKQDMEKMFEHPMIKPLLDVLALTSEKLKVIIATSSEVFGKLGTVEVKLNADGSVEMHKIPGSTMVPKGTWSAANGEVSITMGTIAVQEGMDVRVVNILNELFSNKTIALKLDGGVLLFEIDSKTFTEAMAARYQSATDLAGLGQYAMWQGIGKIPSSTIQITFAR